jgi:hypothetical protein
VQRFLGALLAGATRLRQLQQSLAHRPSADLRACSATRADTEAAVRRQAAEEERARLAREGPSGEPTPQRDMEERVRRETDERLGRQARDAAAAVQGGLLPRVKQLLRA